MRYGIRWQWDDYAYLPNDMCAVQSVTTPYDRDWFLIVAAFAGNPTKFKVYAYDTRALAEADYAANTITNYLAGMTGTGTASTGALQTVTLTRKTGSSYDPTPMTVSLTVRNRNDGVTINWAMALCYWVADAESLLIERMQDILQAYCATHESLALLGVESADIYANPYVSAPEPPPISVDLVLDAPLTATEFGNQGFADTVAITLRGRVLDKTPDTARETAAQLATTLRAIALSQRTWGDMAAETEIGQSMRPSVTDDASAGYLATCEVPLVVYLPDWAPAQDAAYPVGRGGKYAFGAVTNTLPIVGAPNPGGGVGHGGSGSIVEP